MDYNEYHDYKWLFRNASTEAIVGQIETLRWLMVTKLQQSLRAAEVDVNRTDLIGEAAMWSTRLGALEVILWERRSKAKVAAGVMGLGACA